MKQETPLQRSLSSVAAQNSGNEGIVVLDSDFEPIAADAGAEFILRDLEGKSGNGSPSAGLPTVLREAIRSHPQSAWNSLRLRLRVSEREYECRSFLIIPQNGFFRETMLALHLRRVSSLRDAVSEVAAEYHLTGREQEVLVGISMGLTSKELATRLKISPNTVNSFLRLVMIKMGMTTRSGIVGKLLQ